MYTRSNPSPRKRRGAVTLLVAVSLVALVGVTAIVVDGGLLFDRRRHVQAAADAAALAAAADLYANYPTNSGQDPASDARDSALTCASANGYNNNGTSSVVTVNVPPTAGAFTGMSGYVEVVVQYNEPRYFSTIWGSQDTPVRARAVARGRYETINTGILVLDLNERAALNAHGNGSAVVQNAPVIVNSNDTSAVLATGNGQLQAPTFQITGNYSSVGQAQIIGTKQTGVRPTPDPLRYLPVPDPNQMSAGTSTVTNLGGGWKRYDLTPGVFAGGLSFSGKSTVVMAPGIYYMDRGGLSFSGQGNLTAPEVLIYNAPSSISQKLDITGQGSVTLTPPTSGVYRGISIFQDRTADVMVKVTGNGQFNVSGTMYAANALIMIEGNGDAGLGSQYISRLLDLGGNGDLNIIWNPDLAPKTRVYGLVE